MIQQIIKDLFLILVYSAIVSACFIAVSYIITTIYCYIVQKKKKMKSKEKLNNDRYNK